MFNWHLKWRDHSVVFLCGGELLTCGLVFRRAHDEKKIKHF